MQHGKSLLPHRGSPKCGRYQRRRQPAGQKVPPSSRRCKNVEERAPARLSERGADSRNLADTLSLTYPHAHFSPWLQQRVQRRGKGGRGEGTWLVDEGEERERGRARKRGPPGSELGSRQGRGRERGLQVCRIAMCCKVPLEGRREAANPPSKSGQSRSIETSCRVSTSEPPILRGKQTNSRPSSLQW